MDEQLSTRQAMIYDYLFDFKDRNRFAPSIGSMADHFGLSKSVIEYHLHELERKGYIYRPRHPSGRAMAQVYLKPEEASDGNK